MVVNRITGDGGGGSDETLVDAAMVRYICLLALLVVVAWKGGKASSDVWWNPQLFLVRRRICLCLGQSLCLGQLKYFSASSGWNGTPDPGCA